MLISFSEAPMLPYIIAGIQQAAGQDVGSARVKRQTIRRLGPRGQDVLEYAAGNDDRCPYDLHLWWKSRTKQRTRLGTVTNARAYPVKIEHARMIGDRTGEATCMVIHHGAAGERIVWDPHGLGQVAEAYAYADGFDSARAFMRYFVPRIGETFRGLMFKW